ncbi:unnamed protein product [Symbiodinium microadriaticum]|nr:unnamed protein product [Symbiodinium microadriaticum]
MQQLVLGSRHTSSVSEALPRRLLARGPFPLRDVPWFGLEAHEHSTVLLPLCGSRPSRAYATARCSAVRLWASARLENSSMLSAAHTRCTCSYPGTDFCREGRA